MDEADLMNYALIFLIIGILFIVSSAIFGFLIYIGGFFLFLSFVCIITAES